MRSQKCGLATWALLAALLSGCDGSESARSRSSAEAETEAEAEPELGSVELRLSFPDGTRLDSLTYSIYNLFFGQAAYGAIAVGEEPRIEFQVGNLPAAPFYQLGLSGTTSDGTPCSGQVPDFEIVAGATAVLRTTLICGTGDVPASTGNARVEVEIENRPSCPHVAGISAYPLRSELGFVSLQGYATTSSASFAWSVSPEGAGVFLDPLSASTSFICSRAGTHELTLTVSGDPECAPRADRVEVTCLPGEEPPPVPAITGSYAVRTSVFAKARNGSEVLTSKTLGYALVHITSAPDGTLQLSEQGCWTQSLPRPGDTTQAYAWSKPAWVQAIPPLTGTLIANEDGTYTRPALPAHVGWDPARQPLSCSASSEPVAPWPSGWGSTCSCNAPASELPPYDRNTAPYDCRLLDADGDGQPGISAIAATNAPSSPDANPPALGATAYAALDRFDSWSIVPAPDGRHSATISDQSRTALIGCTGLACVGLSATPPATASCPQALNRVQFVPVTESADSCAEIIAQRNTLFVNDQDPAWPDDSACPPPP